MNSKSTYLTLNVLEMYVLYSCVIHQGQLKVIDSFLYGGVEHVFRSFLPEQVQYLSHSVETYNVLMYARECCHFLRYLGSRHIQRFK